VRVATLGPVAETCAQRRDDGGPYRIEDWGKTWLNPNKERVLARVPAIALPLRLVASDPIGEDAIRLT
jgi:hypothetical protein